MARFYGWSPDDIQNLSTHEFAAYQKAIKILEAQEWLVQLKTVDFPNMKDSARKEIGKEVHKSAFPQNYTKNVRKVTTKELFEVLTKR